MEMENVLAHAERYVRLSIAIPTEWQLLRKHVCVHGRKLEQKQ